jgi:cyclopropane fatty-acyl-phospholipid synthase-like methyltransferase
MKLTALAAAAMLTGILAGPTALAAQQHQPGSKPDHMQHRFDDPAKYAKSFDDPARDAWQMPDKVIQALAITDGMSVADIGSGTGYFSVKLATAAPKAVIYGADIEPKMVEYLSKRAAAAQLTNITAVLAGSTSPNLPRPVDLVLVVDTYHHLPDRVAYFRNLRKSLTSTGRVAIIDFRKSAPDGPPPEFRFTPQEIEAEMTKAGFRLEQSHDFLPRQHFLVFR